MLLYLPPSSFLELCTFASTCQLDSDTILSEAYRWIHTGKMRPAARSCAPFVPSTRSQLWLRGLGTQSLAAISRPIPLKACLQCSSRREIPSLTTRGSRTSGISHAPLVRAPRALAQSQVRFFRKANYVERIGDNEKTEEILETLEVKDDERDDRPQRQVLDEEGKKYPPPKSQMEKWSEHMTQGT